MYETNGAEHCRQWAPPLSGPAGGMLHRAAQLLDEKCTPR